MSKNKNMKVPFSAKIYWVITWIVMVVLLCMVGRNFIGSIVFGTGTEKKEITYYYNTGFSDALSGKEGMQSELEVKNPLLIKSYNKGFREGLDKKWQEQEK